MNVQKTVELFRITLFQRIDIVEWRVFSDGNAIAATRIASVYLNRVLEASARRD